MADVDFHGDQDDLNDVPLEGDMTVPLTAGDGNDDELSTLDEPVKDTVLRDLRAVGVKFFHVLYPKQSTVLLREWDLWGPLILCVFLALMLQSSPQHLDQQLSGGPEFSEVFVIFWVGSVVVTLNSKLLGGNISFFQSVCVLGYCVTPLAIALTICRLILLAHQTTALFIVRFCIIFLSFGWSTFAATAFLGDIQSHRRKVLAMYPIFLFYFIISWLAISHTS
ncbi:protein YIPF6 [Octopus bimaculoides]|uniref:Protein YIPF n=1 Tax=Octopus bimaculoides TaxID=37653 RepID=A0A0L8FW87_OCTBM|nr:protein YIPF6 [Octopus bimaculoides]|eukprot:XP_014786334.1 PREDICTED: protein YIPF6-like [Octopus bimaculoides]